METVIRTTTHASEIQFLVSLLTNMPEQTPEFIEAFKSGNEIAFPYGEDGIFDIPYGRRVVTVLYKPVDEKEKREILAFLKEPKYGGAEMDAGFISEMLPVLRVALTLGYFVNSITGEEITHIRFHNGDEAAFSELAAILPTKNVNVLVPKGGF